MAIAPHSGVSSDLPAALGHWCRLLPLLNEVQTRLYVAQKALEQAKTFLLSDLKQAHELLYKFDLNIKTGRMSAGLAVDLVTDQFIRS